MSGRLGRPDQVAERGEAEWKTLISACLTRSEGLTMGVARLRHGGSLRSHRMSRTRRTLSSMVSGVLTIDGTAGTVGPGVAVVSPGNALHSVTGTGESELRFAYVLAADSFEDIEYVFGE